MGEFSLRWGDPNRLGSPDGESWLEGRFTGDGVLGDVPSLPLPAWKLAGLRSCSGDHAFPRSGSLSKCKSERELRRFFLGNIVTLVGVPSPILLNVLVLRCELPGRDWGSFKGAEPEVVGLS